MKRTSHPRLVAAYLTALVVSATLATADESAQSKARGADMKVSAIVVPPTIMAVRFHHDMCPYCKKLEAQYAKLMGCHDFKSVLFVTLDLSSESMQQQAALMLGALGLDHVWTGDLSGIGTVVFVDGKSKEVLSTFRADGSKPIKTAMQEAVELQKDQR